MLNETWNDHYDRMLRSRDRLARASSPDWEQGSAEARDALYHFFQDAYHLKDWLKADPASGVTSRDVEVLFDSNNPASAEEMRICADLCNGTKHGRLDPVRRARTGDHGTAFATQGVTVYLGAGAAHEWTVESNGRTWDALELAERVVATWDTWLRQKGLR